MDQLQAPASKYMTNNNSDWFVVLTDGNNYYISLTDGQGHEPFLSIPMDITAEQAARSGFLPTVSQVFDAWLAGDVTVRLKSIATAFQVEQQTAALERSKQEQVKLLTEGQRVIDEVLSTAATNRDAMSGPQVRPAGR
jgi:hypothetical protein